jgi:hypothetical protein
MSAWWVGLSAAQATVSCGEHAHHLRWERGAVTAPDHGDPADERALAALGGEPFACIELLSAWEHHRDDLRLLTLAPRGPSDVLRIDPEALAQRGGIVQGGGRQRLGRGNPRAAIGGARRLGAQARGTEELVTLLTLDGGIQDRLQATVAAAWARRIRTGHTRLARSHAQLHAALHGRVLAAVSSWQGAPGIAVELTMVAPDAPRSLARGEHGIKAELPFAWLVEVWAKGLATIYGRFCLGAATTDGRRWTLTTVGPDLGEPETVTVTLPGLRVTPADLAEET